MLIKVLFWINISLFILHEMDAVKTREWKMMIFMNRLSDDSGHIIFTALHFPLFILIFFLMKYYFEYLVPVVAALFILHQILHIIFRKHTENRMNNTFSRVIILMMFLNSCVTLLLYFDFLKNHIFYFL
ncbi:MAG: hypothetical protein CVV49_08525 [Spirochaetae bacterium HGW-Spirochaetae-5]|nr:MAG: hypothetical protein CVV49_08525 [Spirochaetae bacterium HGW-Spirochaetae-5]